MFTYFRSGDALADLEIPSRVVAAREEFECGNAITADCILGDLENDMAAWQAQRDAAQQPRLLARAA